MIHMLKKSGERPSRKSLKRWRKKVWEIMKKDVIP
jgi:hypothetical protein